MSANPRLTRIAPTPVEHSFANGNRASATINGVTTTASYTLDDQIIHYGDNSYAYDNDGYLESKATPEGTTTYTYNTLGAITQVILPDGTNIEYPQDAQNRRVAKEINGTVVEKYLWADLTTLLVIYDGEDNLVQRFEYAGGRMPIAMTDSNADRYYLHYNQVGSLRAVSDTNDNVAKEIAYDTYGNILSDSNPDFKVPFGFAGGLYDRDTGLVHFGYREYDAYTGKWTAKDPIGFAGGDSNLYGYVLEDPVRGFDPSGLVDLNLLDNNSRESWALDNLPWNNPSNTISIGGHGCAVGMPEKVECDENHLNGYDSNNMEELANRIKALQKFQKNPSMAIELKICFAGSTNLPQVLSDLLLRPVISYTNSYYPSVGIGFGPTVSYPRVESGRTW